MQGDRGLSAVVVMERPQRRDVEVGEHVTVHHENVSSKPNWCGEANGAGGVEGFGLDGVVHAHARDHVAR